MQTSIFNSSQQSKRYLGKNKLNTDFIKDKLINKKALFFSTSTETRKSFVRNAQPQIKTEAKKETDEKEKTKVSDKSIKQPTADDVYYKTHCHIKEEDDLHQLPANLENRKC